MDLRGYLIPGPRGQAAPGEIHNFTENSLSSYYDRFAMDLAKLKEHYERKIYENATEGAARIAELEGVVQVMQQSRAALQRTCEGIRELRMTLLAARSGQAFAPSQAQGQAPAQSQAEGQGQEQSVGDRGPTAGDMLPSAERSGASSQDRAVRGEPAPGNVTRGGGPPAGASAGEPVQSARQVSQSAGPAPGAYLAGSGAGRSVGEDRSGDTRAEWEGRKRAWEPREGGPDAHEDVDDGARGRSRKALSGATAAAMGTFAEVDSGREAAGDGPATPSALATLPLFQPQPSKNKDGALPPRSRFLEPSVLSNPTHPLSLPLVEAASQEPSMSAVSSVLRCDVTTMAQTMSIRNMSSCAPISRYNSGTRLDKKGGGGDALGSSITTPTTNTASAAATNNPTTNANTAAATNGNVFGNKGYPPSSKGANGGGGAGGGGDGGKDKSAPTFRPRSRSFSQPKGGEGVPEFHLVRHPDAPFESQVDVEMVHRMQHSSIVSSVALSHGGDLAATGSNHMATIYRTRTGEKLCTFIVSPSATLDAPARDAEAKPGGAGGAGADAGGKTDGGGDGGSRPASASTSSDVYVRALAISPDCARLATGGELCAVRLWDLASIRGGPDGGAAGRVDAGVSSGSVSSESLAVLRGHQEDVFALAYAHDGQLLASGSGDGTVRLWDLSEATVARMMDHKSAAAERRRKPGGGVRREGSPGRYRGSSDEDEDGDEEDEDEAGYWPCARELLMPRGGEDSVVALSFAADSMSLVTGSIGSGVLLWDVETGKLLGSMAGHADAVYSVDVSPNGRHIVSGSLDRTVKMWDLSSRACVQTYTGHTDYVLSVAYSPEKCWLISASKDRSIIFWDIRYGRPTTTLFGHANSVLSLAVSPVGGLMMTGSGDETTAVWKYGVHRAGAVLSG